MPCPSPRLLPVTKATRPFNESGMGEQVQERNDYFRENRNKWQSLIYLTPDN
jgi:hypothetical protein